MDSHVKSQIFAQIQSARQKVYELFPATPLEKCEWIPGCKVFLKREDLSPIHSYKWRGAYHMLSQFEKKALTRGVVAASAGNHAQGVAVTAKKLAIQATLFMPEGTPQVKRNAVKSLGEGFVQIVIAGKCYDDACDAAKLFAEQNQLPFLHPFDDLAVLGGNGTLAQEVVVGLGQNALDVVYLQIGGGGMAAAVALYLKEVYPALRVVGVEAQGQASMSAAFQAGKPVTLSQVDAFCDGTSVKRVGDLCYTVCREVFDEIITVSPEEVARAIEMVWENKRFIPEPSGALGFAGLLKQRENLRGKNVLSVITGSNMDFTQLEKVLAYSKRTLNTIEPARIPIQL